MSFVNQRANQIRENSRYNQDLEFQQRDNFTMNQPIQIPQPLHKYYQESEKLNTQQQYKQQQQVCAPKQGNPSSSKSQLNLENYVISQRLGGKQVQQQTNKQSTPISKLRVEDPVVDQKSERKQVSFKDFEQEKGVFAKGGLISPQGSQNWPFKGQGQFYQSTPPSNVNKGQFQEGGQENSVKKIIQDQKRLIEEQQQLINLQQNLIHQNSASKLGSLVQSNTPIKINAFSQKDCTLLTPSLLESRKNFFTNPLGTAVPNVFTAQLFPGSTRAKSNEEILIQQTHLQILKEKEAALKYGGGGGGNISQLLKQEQELVEKEIRLREMEELLRLGSVNCSLQNPNDLYCDRTVQEITPIRNSNKNENLQNCPQGNVGFQKKQSKPIQEIDYLLEQKQAELKELEEQEKIYKSRDNWNLQEMGQFFQPESQPNQIPVSKKISFLQNSNQNYTSTRQSDEKNKYLTRFLKQQEEIEKQSKELAILKQKQQEEIEEREKELERQRQFLKSTQQIEQNEIIQLEKEKQTEQERQREKEKEKEKQRQIEFQRREIERQREIEIDREIERREIERREIERREIERREIERRKIERREIESEKEQDKLRENQERDQEMELQARIQLEQKILKEQMQNYQDYAELQAQDNLVKEEQKEQPSSPESWTFKIVDEIYIYEGYLNSKKQREGHGILRNSMGQVLYKGEWLNDCYDGFGILYNEEPTYLKVKFDFKDFSKIKTNWTRYEGWFREGTLHGKGKLDLSNGEQIDGEYYAGKVNGNVRFTNIRGQQMLLKYSDDQLIDYL